MVFVCYYFSFKIEFNDVADCGFYLCGGDVISWSTSNVQWVNGTIQVSSLKVEKVHFYTYIYLIFYALFL